MAGDDGEQAQIVEGGTTRLREVDQKGIRIWGLEFLYQSQVEPTRAINAEVGDGLKGELHVLGGKGLSIVPEDVVAQVKGDGQPIGRDPPGPGQVGNKRARPRVHGQQAIEDQASDGQGSFIIGQEGVEGDGLYQTTHNDGAPLRAWRRGGQNGLWPGAERRRLRSRCRLRGGYRLSSGC